MSGVYLPYITCSKKEKLKIDAILNYGINIDGLIIDYRRLVSDCWRETINIITSIINYNSKAIILVDPRTDAFQANLSTRINIKSLNKIFGLADYNRNHIGNDKFFKPREIKGRLYKIIDNLYRTTRVPRIGTQTFEPSYFIPPYFVAHSYDDEWYKLTIESINISLKLLNKKKEILAPIAIDRNLLSNRDEILRLINDYRNLEVNGYIIFPYNINEHDASLEILGNLALLAVELKRTGRTVIVHSAEFGNVLISLGIDAITCGICSHKNPYTFTVFEKGLAEIARTEEQLYVHSIFRKLHVVKFIKLYELLPKAYSCECPICEKYKDSYIDLVEEAGYVDFSVHYIYWKNKEVKKYANEPTILLKDLENAKALINDYNDKIGEEYFFIEDNKYRYYINSSYLDKWSIILSTLSHSDSTNL